MEEMCRQRPLWQCGPRPDLERSVSIDDFLAGYRHERNYILSFLTCLDEPASDHATLSKNASLLHGLLPVSCVSSQRSCSTLPSSTIASFEEMHRPQATTIQDIDRKRSCPPDAAPARKSGRTKAFPESHEERRRRKNREYQRRFREKRMRLELQRQFHAACPPCQAALSV